MAQEKLIVYVSGDMKNRIKKLAERKNVSMGTIVKICLFDYVFAQEKILGLEPKRNPVVMKEPEESSPEYFHGHD